MGDEMSGTTSGWPMCQCGCGRPVEPAKYTDSRRGYVKGRPLRFIKGHSGGPGGSYLGAVKLEELRSELERLREGESVPMRDALLADDALAAMFDVRKSAEIEAALAGKDPNWATRLEIEREAMRAALTVASPRQERSSDGH